MKVKFIPINGMKEVEIRVDGKRHSIAKVQYDEHGESYINVPNLLRPNGDILTKNSFIHRIGDMVQHIKNGWGDVIVTHHLIVRTQSVLWFLNRTYGESLRKQSLEGWKDTEFAWAVFVRNSIFGDMPLTVHEETRPISVAKFEGSADHFQTKFYDTEEEAQRFITNTLDAVRPLLKGLYKIPDDEEHKVEINAYYNHFIKPLTGAKDIVAMYGDKDGVDKKNPLYVGQIIRGFSGTFNSRAIFIAHMNSGLEAYMCKGDALDRALDDLSDNLIWGIQEGASVTEWTLKYRGSEEDLFPKVLNPTATIYRIETQGQCNGWFRYIDDCFNDPCYETLKKDADSRGLKLVLTEATLHPQNLQPIIPTKEKPYNMILKIGKKGLVGKAALRPDEVGQCSNKEKFYFPDRSCKDSLCAGLVKVTEVNDRGNYGFIKGTMVKFSQPSEEALAEYLTSDHTTLTIRETIKLQFVTNPIWGSAIRWVSSASRDVYIAVGEDGVLQRQDVLSEYDHSKDEVSETINVMDFICTGYTGKTWKELADIVPHIPGLWRLQMDQSIKYISDDFDAAIDCGLIDLRKYRNFHVCIMDNDKMHKAAALLQDGLIDVLEEAKKINEEAQVRFANLRKKGKL